MNLALHFILALALSNLVVGQIYYGPYYFPNYTEAGADDCCVEKSASITFGEFNETHFYMNIDVFGNYWFGIAFADSAQTDGEMYGADAWVFANFQGSTGLSVVEYNLGAASLGQADSNPDVHITNLYTGTWKNKPYYSMNLQRAYDTGSRDDFVVTLSGSLDLLWAIGEDLFIHSDSGHGVRRGHRSFDLGGTTGEPTPAPSYRPTDPPSVDPSPAPSKGPTVHGATANPSKSPTWRPSNPPTDVTGSPTDAPTTRRPTRSPLGINATPYPTPEPTPAPSPRPTKSPTDPTTALPTRDPLSVGETADPSPGPTPGPTPLPTSAPNRSPTPAPLSSAEKDAAKRGILDKYALYLMIGGAVILLCCFCCALYCFHRRDKKRKRLRDEKHARLMQVEIFKQKQGVDIDNSPQNKTAAGQHQQQKPVSEEEDDDDYDVMPGPQTHGLYIDTSGDEKQSQIYGDGDEDDDVAGAPVERYKKPHKRKRKRKRKRPKRQRGNDGRSQFNVDNEKYSDVDSGGGSGDEVLARSRARSKPRTRSRKRKPKKRRHKHRSKFQSGGDDNSAIVRSHTKKRKRLAIDNDESD